MQTILTLNDDPQILAIFNEILEAAGFRSLHTSDGHDALSILLKEPVDLFIQDIARPDMDGFQLYRLIKSEERLRDIPMLIVTGYLASVTQVVLGGVIQEGLYKVALCSVPPCVLYVEGCMRLPVDRVKILETIKRTLDMQSQLSLAEQARTLRYQQLWSHVNA